MAIEVTQELGLAAVKIIQELYTTRKLRPTIESNGLTTAEFFAVLDARPDIERQYCSYQLALAELDADELVDISDEHGDPVRNRNRIQARQWRAAKMKPHKFGERIELNVNTTIDIGATLLEARKRLTLLQNSVIDADFVTVSNPVPALAEKDKDIFE